jgi:hypothetical protein
VTDSFERYFDFRKITSTHLLSRIGNWSQRKNLFAWEGTDYFATFCSSSLEIAEFHYIHNNIHIQIYGEMKKYGEQIGSYVWHVRQISNPYRPSKPQWNPKRRPSPFMVTAPTIRWLVYSSYLIDCTFSQILTFLRGWSRILAGHCQVKIYFRN